MGFHMLLHLDYKEFFSTVLTHGLGMIVFMMARQRVFILKAVNTEVCEHMFNHINKHRNCKAMNQANFFMFWIYILDLHNGLDACEPVPRSEYRGSLVKVEEVDLTKVKKMDIDDIALGMNKMTVKEDLPFKCALCGATYKANHTLEQHLQEKHGEEKKLFKCIFTDKGNVTIIKHGYSGALSSPL